MTKLKDLYETYASRCFHVRNDLDQGRILLAFLNRSNQALDEKQRLQRAAAKDGCIDVVVNQADGVTEVYVPVKEDQKGSLVAALLRHCEDTVKGVVEYDKGSYKGFVVLRTGAEVDKKDLATKLAENVPAELVKAKATVVPAYNASFTSAAKYNGPLPIRIENKLVHRNGTHSSKTPVSDKLLKTVNRLIREGKDVSDAYEALSDLDPSFVKGVWCNTKRGVYSQPLKPVDDKLYAKLCSGFDTGKSNDELATQYDLNKFQVIAQRARYTRQKNNRR